MLQARSLLAPLLWTLYVLVPATGWGLLHGMPIGLVGGTVLFLLWWTWRYRGTLPGRSFVIALVVVKLLAGLFMTVERGFEADYFANAQWTPPIARGTQFRSRSFTRIDRRLVFGGADRPSFPLYFFNDGRPSTFNKRGDELPFSVTWRGYVRATRAEDRRQFYLRGTGVSAELWVDGAQTVRLDPTAVEAFERARWPAGLRQLTVRLSVPPGAARRFEAGFLGEDGDQIPLGAAHVVARPYPAWRLSADRVLRILSRVLDSLLLAVLGGLFTWTVLRMLIGATVRGLHRRDGIVALAWVAALAGGLLFAAPALNRPVLPDYVAYEWLARDILLTGPKIVPSLYAYFLALTHLVLGEDLSGVYVVQWLLAWLTVVVVWKIGVRLFGHHVGNAAAALAVFYFAGKLVSMAGMLLSENVFLPLVMLWTLWMIRMAMPKSKARDTFWAGTTGGLSAFALSSLVATWYWVLVLPPLVWARRRVGESYGAVLGMFAIMILIVSVPAVVHWNSFSTVPISPSVSINESKALYTLGFFDASAPGEGTSPGYIATWSAAIIGLVVLMSGRVMEGLRGPARLVPFAISVTQFIALALIIPVERQIVTLYISLLPYAALGIMWTVNFLVPPEEA